jgi:hypothetical protein
VSNTFSEKETRSFLFFPGEGGIVMKLCAHAQSSHSGIW